MNSQPMRKAVRQIFPHLTSLLGCWVRFSRAYGYFKSLKVNRPVDADCKPIPWYTYPSIDYLEQFDFSGKVIFEYSSGYGSLWWSRRCHHLYSVEDNPEWFQEICTQKTENHSLTLQKNEQDYVNYIDRLSGKIDVVIVDGNYRAACAKKIVGLVEDGARFDMIIFDNSDWWPETIRYLEEMTEYIRVDFHGIGPINDYTWSTSVFLSKEEDALRPQSFNYSKNALVIKSEDDLTSEKQ